MDQHTPGPWAVTHDGEGNPLIAGPESPDPVTEARYHFIASLFTVPEALFRNREYRGPLRAREREANARLIAAAPTMLSALEAVESILRDFPGGEDFASWVPVTDKPTGNIGEIIRAAIRRARGGA